MSYFSSNTFFSHFSSFLFLLFSNTIIFFSFPFQTPTQVKLPTHFLPNTFVMRHNAASKAFFSLIFLYFNFLPSIFILHPYFFFFDEQYFHVYIIFSFPITNNKEKKEYIGIHTHINTPAIITIIFLVISFIFLIFILILFSIYFQF